MQSKPQLETRLETQTVLYPKLQLLVRFLGLDHRRIVQQLQSEAKDNPFLVERIDANQPSHSEPEWYEAVAASPTLQSHLEDQIITLDVAEIQRQALLHLLQWLSPSGYLEETPTVWARGTQWHPQELAAVVPLLQQLDPAGVGARSLPECLLLQLEPNQELAILLVSHHLDQLAACVGKSAQQQELLQTLRQTLPDLTLPQLQQAIQQIQALEPRPGRNFSTQPPVIVTPDLKVQQQNGIWQVSLATEIEQRFVLHPETVALLQSSQQSRERQRLEAMLQKARDLLTALSQWQENLLKVGQFLCERQQAFLSSRDPLDLIPTAQQLIAQSVGLSNATISRTVRSRYLLIDASPHQTIPLASLCTAITVGGRTPQQLQQSIIELVQSELPTQPYSDAQLAQLLKLRFGVAIARRTVAKYRNLLGIANAASRRQKSAKL